MRGIKFRAWDGITEQLLPVERIDFRNDLISLNEGDNSLTDTSEMMTLMQYTGLKDKNGKEVYEGDLITITNPFIKHEEIGVAKIVFSHDYVGGWVAEAKGEHLNIGTRTHMISVVGNIYENPELLNS